MPFVALLYYAFTLLSMVAVAYCMVQLAITKQEKYLLAILVLFLSLYQNTLIVTYQITQSPLLVQLMRYFKDAVVYGIPTLFIFAHPNIFRKGFRLHFLDYLFLAFAVLSFVYVFLPLGQASFGSKAIYLKNMLLWMLTYLMGRNSKMKFEDVKWVLVVILWMGVAAFFFNSTEKLFDQHLQSHIGFESFTINILEDVPVGHYGLTWTFESSDGTKRFASIYANPLEFASGMILMFAIAIILMRSTPFLSNKVVYSGAVLISVINLLGAYSRASLVAFVGVIFFAGYLLRFYRLILVGVLLVGSAVIYILFFAPRERLNFVIETITFQQASSLGHAIEWLEGVESMIQSPQGIGLAMSGNASGVDDEIKVGGENQFIIYGVQLGVLGLVLYTSMVLLAIWFSYRAYRKADIQSNAVVPFIAATTKFGLLLPLFTSNAEIYLYISLVSWWMVGYSISLLNRLNDQRRLIMNPGKA